MHKQEELFLYSMYWQSSAAITIKRQSRVEHNDSFTLNVFLCEEELSAVGLKNV